MKTQDTTRTVSCPRCGASIDVGEILSRQIEEGLKKSYDARLADERRKFDAREAELEAGRRAVDAERGRLKDEVERGVRERVASERAKIEERLRKSYDDEHAARLKSMEDELSRKSEQVKELNRTRTELERLRREAGEMRESIEAESERKLTETLAAEREKIRRAADEASRMKLGERDAVIEQLKVQLQEMQRRAEQGSMQIQGEVQELAIEEWLGEAFPLDTIGEVKKGARGADCLQTVNTEARRNCGTIYYESKRTKDFQPGWIEKFKADMRAKGATVGVIVTEAMPKDMPRMGMRGGVWICSFEEFKGLSAVLRESVIQISNAVVAQENRGDKMALLYDYLTGHEFRMQIEAIVEGFVQMQDDLASERRAMEAIWKKREKQIEKVILNTTHMHGSIRGIAGAAVPPVAHLGLPGDEGGSGD